MMPVSDKRERVTGTSLRFATNKESCLEALRASVRGLGDTATPVSHARGGLSPRALRRICEYVDGHIGQRINVDALARLANLSICYFVRAFKRSVGITPHEYLIRRRVELTMTLLSGTDMPLSEIALTAGFADQSHCSRRFRQHVGMSPRDYRWLSL
jgi:AraC family transcriptional regulator